MGNPADATSTLYSLESTRLSSVPSTSQPLIHTVTPAEWDGQPVRPLALTPANSGHNSLQHNNSQSLASQPLRTAMQIPDSRIRNTPTPEIVPSLAARSLADETGQLRQVPLQG